LASEILKRIDLFEQTLRLTGMVISGRQDTQRNANTFVAIRGCRQP
jgi:hypothetical protein